MTVERVFRPDPGPDDSPKPKPVEGAAGHTYKPACGRSTPGAIRAARRIANAVNNGLSQSGINIADKDSTEVMELFATIIDRETAAPELLEACKRMIMRFGLNDFNECVWCYLDVRVEDGVIQDCNNPDCDIVQARAAIALAERSAAGKGETS